MRPHTPTIIVLEGADGTGKTTAAGKLKRILNADVLHFGPPERHPLYEYEIALQNITRNTVIDRLHWGELVYGPIYRGESKLSFAGKLHIDMMLAARGATIFHFDQSLDVVKMRVAERGDNYVQAEHLDQILRHYRVIRDEASPVHRRSVIDPTDEDLRQLVWLARGAQHAARGLSYWKMYVGPPKPRVLLVGDQRNNPEDEHLAAFVPYDSASGRFLLEALPTDLWTSTGLANSEVTEGDVATLWRFLDRPHVVALGNLAHKRLEQLTIPHGTVPHPQYVRRFHHEKKAEYGQAIAAAIYGKDMR